jgi:hypothetical protein
LVFLARQKLSKRKENEQNDAVERKQKKLKAMRKVREEYESKSRFPINHKDQNAERSRLLNLAMDWECIDAAKEFIFQSSLDNILVRIFLSFSSLSYFISFLE